jgi:hypothetical protein
MGPLRAHYQARVDHLEARRNGGDSARGIGGKIEKVEVELIEAERARLNELVREGVIGDDVRRRIEHDLDLGEQRSRGNRTGLGPGEAD